MALFTFSVNGAPRAIDLLGLGTDQIEEAIKRLRGVFGADFQPVSLRGTTTPSSGSLKIGSGNQLSDRFGNVVSPQDFISGAIASSPQSNENELKGPPPIRGLDELDSPLSLSGMSDRSGQRAAYLRDLDRRDITGGYGRQIQERNYYPAQSAFFGEGVLEGLQNKGTAGYNPTSFEDFLSTAPNLNMGGRARDAFTNLANYVSPTQGRSHAVRSPEQRLAISEYTNPDPDSQRNIFSNLSDLAMQSARSSFNPLIGNQMFRSSKFDPANLQAQFMGQQGTVNPSIGGDGFNTGQGNFVDFLRTRFGL